MSFAVGRAPYQLLRVPFLIIFYCYFIFYFFTYLFVFFFFFFFSSRRRHTRCGRDWSSDVCSSDLRRCCPADRLRQGTFSKPASPVPASACDNMSSLTVRRPAIRARRFSMGVSKIGRASCRERV